jgi:hypothetical protein
MAEPIIEQAPPKEGIEELGKLMADTLEGNQPAQPITTEQANAIPQNSPAAEPQPQSQPQEQQPQPDVKEEADTPPKLSIPEVDALQAPNTKTGKAQWNDLKKTYQSRIDELESKLTQAQKSAVPEGVDLTNVVKENEQLRNELRTLNVERDPAFQAEIDSLKQAQYRIAEGILGPEGSKTFQAIVNQPDGPFKDNALTQLTDGLSEVQKARVVQLVGSFDNIEAQKQAAISRQVANWEETQQRQKLAQLQKQEEFQQDFSRIRNEFMEQPFFKKRDGDDDYNTAVDNMMKVAEKIAAGDITQQERITTAHYAAMAPALLHNLTEAHDRIKTLENTLDKAGISQPKVGEGAPSPDPDANLDQYPADMTLAERVAKEAERMGFTR